MKAEIIKTQILKEYRKRQYYICATEVDTGIEIADVLLMNDKEIIEIEIKLTWPDFLADFKKPKHIIPPNKSHLKYIYLKANRFYFCVPSPLKEKCVNYLNENHYEYGLIVSNEYITQIKRCKRLKELDFNEQESIKKQIIRRATSELIKLREEQYTMRTVNG